MTLNNKLLKREYKKTLFPVMFSILGGIINTLIDSIFVSQKLGQSGLSAVNLSMPIYLIMCTFGSLVGSGASILSANELGRENNVKAKEYCRYGITLCVLAGAVLTIAGLILCRPISTFLAGNDTELTELVYGYILITIFGCIPLLISYFPIYYLPLEGKTRDISIMMVIMIGCDVLFDLLFIYILNLGTYGAATASLLSTLIACVYSFIKLEICNSDFKFGFSKSRKNDIISILRTGSPTAMGNLADTLKLLFLNIIITEVGGTGYIAVWSVLNTLSELSITVTSGVPSAASPLIGVYYISKENKSLSIITKLEVRYGILLSTVFCLAIIIFHEFIEMLFSFEYSIMLPILCLGIYAIFDSIGSILIGFFNCTEKIALSNVMVALRKLILPILSILFCAENNLYLWLFLPISAILTVVCEIILVLYYKKNKTDTPLSFPLLLDERMEKENLVLDFTTGLSSEEICNASDQIQNFCKDNGFDKKITMYIQLAIEEILVIIATNDNSLESADLRVIALPNEKVLRIRYSGKEYNPFSQSLDNDEMMGVAMLSKIASNVKFSYVIGMNVTNVLF